MLLLMRSLAPDSALRSVLLLAALLSAAGAQPQTADPRVAEFKKRAAALAAHRREGVDESEAPQEAALKLLDAVVLEELNRAAPPFDLAALNHRLEAFIVQDPPLGEGYVLLAVSRPAAGPAAYALAANFGFSGPSAARLYVSAAGAYQLAARMDKFTHKDFYDDYLELAPISAADVVFVTITGRSDELKTGSFTAWRYAAGKLQTLWASDLLEHSTYENRPDGFRLSYCARADEDDPRKCALFARERHLWDGSSWKVASREESPRP
jgi:hypothetical protein